MKFRNVIFFGFVFFALSQVLLGQSSAEKPVAEKSQAPSGSSELKQDPFQEEPTEAPVPEKQETSGQVESLNTENQTTDAEALEVPKPTLPKETTDEPGQAQSIEGQEKTGQGPKFVPGNLEEIPQEPAEEAAETKLEPASAAEGEQQPMPATEEATESAQGQLEGQEAQPAQMPETTQQEPVLDPEPAVGLPQKSWKVEGLKDLLRDDEQPMTRIAILHSAGDRKKAEAITLVLNKFRRKELEKNLGGVVEVVNFSRAEARSIRRGKIFYRKGYLKAAILLARIVPEKQTVLPMSPETEANTIVDVEIHLSR